MQKIICILLLVFTSSVHAFAYVSEIKFLAREEIAKLSDEALIDAYIEAVVELKATETFHATSGFTPKEYENYKDLLKYKILLIQELDKRKLPAPRTDAATP